MYRGEADWTLIGKVKNNPRIHIPIIGNGDVDSGPKAAEMFDEFVEHWHASGRPLEVYLGMLPDGDPFKTILVEWRTDSSRIEVDRKILKYVSTAFGDLLADKNMTRAEACRVTRLNKGNFYAFLKGDTSKMSRKTAMNAYREIAAL